MPISRIEVLGERRAVGSDGEAVALSGPRFAILASLALASRPVSRLELVEAVGISRGSLNSLLTRASQALGLDTPAHVAVGPGVLTLNAAVVGSDVVEVRSTVAGPDTAEAAERLRLLWQPATAYALGLIDTHPLAAELRREIELLDGRVRRFLGGSQLEVPKTSVVQSARSAGSGEVLGAAGSAAAQWLAGCATAQGDDGRVLEPLADHLLSRMGGPTLRALRAKDSTFDRYLILDGGVGVADNAWLRSLAVDWCVRHQLSSASAPVLRRLIGCVDGGAQQRLCAHVVSQCKHLVAEHPEVVLATVPVAVAFVSDPYLEAEGLAVVGDANRSIGTWEQARVNYETALELLLTQPVELSAVAGLALRLSRLTWSEKTGALAERLLHAVLDQLPVEETALRGRIELCLAGGSYQSGTTVSHVDVDGIAAALDAALLSAEPAARCWSYVHARKAVLGLAPLQISLAWAQRIVDSARGDVELEAHGWQAIYVDTLRAADLEAAARALGQLEHLAESPVSAEQSFSAVVARTCWDLAAASVSQAKRGLAAEEGFAAQLGAQTVRQILIAHDIWLALLRDDTDRVRAGRQAALAMLEADPANLAWAAAATRLGLVVGEIGSAAEAANSVLALYGTVDKLPQGSHRLPFIAGLAQLAFEDRSALGPDVVLGVERALGATDNELILAGWPTVVFGARDEYRAMALAASGDFEQALEVVHGLERKFGRLRAIATSCRTTASRIARKSAL